MSEVTLLPDLTVSSDETVYSVTRIEPAAAVAGAELEVEAE